MVSFGAAAWFVITVQVNFEIWLVSGCTCLSLEARSIFTKCSSCMVGSIERLSYHAWKRYRTPFSICHTCITYAKLYIHHCTCHVQTPAPKLNPTTQSTPLKSFLGVPSLNRLYCSNMKTPVAARTMVERRHPPKSSDGHSARSPVD